MLGSQTFQIQLDNGYCEKITLTPCCFAAKQKKLQEISLSEAIDNYIESRNNTLSPSTIRGYRNIQKNRFTSIMHYKLAEIDDWQKICNDEALLCSPKTLRNSYRFIVSVLAETDVFPARITLPQVVANERPWLDPEQIREFIKVVKGQKCEIPALLALCSLRRSEICALDWKNVDLKNNRLKVEGAAVYNENHVLTYKQTNKNASSRRYVPIMIPELQDAMEAVDKKKGLVVHCNPNTIWAQINSVCEANGLPKIGVHGLRHSFASLAYHLGVPEKDCMKIGGWTDNQTMHKIYTHLSDKDVSKYSSKITAFFENNTDTTINVSDRNTN